MDQPVPLEDFCQEGREHLAAGRFVEAKVAYLSALERDPCDGSAFSGLARSLIGLQDYKEARHVLNRALFHHPTSAPILLAHARLLILEQDYAAAVSASVAIPVEDLAYHDALEQKIIALRLAERFDDADAAVRDALSSFPGDRAILAECGRLNFARKQYDAALEAFIAAGSEEYMNWVAEYDTLDDAEPKLQAILSRFPDRIQFLNLRAHVYEAAARFDAAIQSYDEVLSFNPADKEAHEGKIRVLRETGRFEPAVAAVKVALDAVGAEVSILIEQARILFDQKRYDEGVEAYLAADNLDTLIEAIDAIPGEWSENERAGESAISRRPRCLRLLNRVATYQEYQLHYDEAVSTYDRALAVDAKDKEALEGKARTLRHAGRLEAAGEAVDIALGLHPDDDDLLAEHGRLSLAQKDYREAARCCSQTQDTDWFISEISKQRRLRKFDECEQALRTSLQRRPDDPALRINLAYVLHNQAKFDQALAAYDQALVLDPASKDALVNKCVALRVLRRFKEAETAIESGLGLLPIYVGLLNQRGWLYYYWGRFRDAVSAFEGTLAIDGYHDDEDALIGKISALRAQRIQIGDKPLEEAIQDAVKRCPDSGRIGYELGLLHRDRDQIADAEAAFARAAELDPDLLQAHYDRATMLARLGHRHEALQLLLKLKQERPDNQAVADELAYYYRSTRDLARAEEVRGNPAHRSDQCAGHQWAWHRLLRSSAVRRGATPDRACAGAGSPQRNVVRQPGSGDRQAGSWPRYRRTPVSHGWHTAQAGTAKSTDHAGGRVAGEGRALLPPRP
jgi:tetratricopeptide (TPR) repeat protein